MTSTGILSESYQEEEASVSEEEEETPDGVAVVETVVTARRRRRGQSWSSNSGIQECHFLRDECAAALSPADRPPHWVGLRRSGPLSLCPHPALLLPPQLLGGAPLHVPPLAPGLHHLPLVVPRQEDPQQQGHSAGLQLHGAGFLLGRLEGFK